MDLRKIRVPKHSGTERDALYSTILLPFWRHVLLKLEVLFSTRSRSSPFPLLGEDYRFFLLGFHSLASPFVLGASFWNIGLLLFP